MSHGLCDLEEGIVASLVSVSSSVEWVSKSPVSPAISMETRCPFVHLTYGNPQPACSHPLCPGREGAEPVCLCPCDWLTVAAGVNPLSAAPRCWVLSGADVRAFFLFLLGSSAPPPHEYLESEPVQRCVYRGESRHSLPRDDPSQALLGRWCV